VHRTGRLLLGAAGAASAAVLAAWLVGRTPRYGVPAAVEEREVPSSDPRYRLLSVRVRGAGGGTAACVLRRPTAGGGEPLLPVVLLGGIGTGRGAATLVEGRHRALILSCDYPWSDPSDLPLPRIVWRVPDLRRALLATPAALALAATYLLRQPDADTTRLAAIGASLGVPFVAAWAAGDERVRAVALAYGGGDLGTLFGAALRTRVRSGWLRRALAGGAAWLLAPLEPTRTVVRIAPRPVLLVGSLDDERIPRASALGLAAAAREPRTVLWLEGRHIVPRDSALMREIGDSTMAWLTRTLPSLSSTTPARHLR
jgi:hypothetical protein